VGQILSVVDSYDAMTSKRAYRDSRTHMDAMEEVARCSGVHFSPRVAAAFIALPDSVFAAAQEEAPPIRGRFSAGVRSRRPHRRDPVSAVRVV
jgi:HD-GYP domain-containing protein (c-di-GMP phosphodiesterase class II)